MHCFYLAEILICKSQTNKFNCYSSPESEGDVFYGTARSPCITVAVRGTCHDRMPGVR